MTTYLGAATVPNGYNGDTITAHVCYDSGSKQVLEVYPFGYCRSRYLIDVVSKAEAVEQFKTHYLTRDLVAA